MGSGVRREHVVRVRRELLVSCMTCPLCNKLLRDATTVSECLHTFCRKCILKKFTEEELESCPICHIDLGVVPAEKLRPDHNLQDVRSKIFPLTKTLNPKSDSSSLQLPVRRKERSLSSLAVSAPRVSSGSQSLTGRRTKHSRRWKNDDFAPGKKRKGGNDDFAPGKRTKGEEVGTGKRTKVVLEEGKEKSKKQSNLDPESSSSKEKPTTANGAETELWKPLNCLLEAATRSKTLKPLIKQEPQIHLLSPNNTTLNPNSNNNNDVNTPSSTNKPIKLPSKEEKRNIISKEESNNNNDNVVGPSSLMMGRGRKVIRRKNKGARSAEKLFGVASNTRDRRVGPVWFSLVATANREGGGQLPQLSSSYLRIKDGDLTVLSIQKYITQKLNLISEEEVEIVCRGQPVGPTTSLHGLVDLWLRSETSNHRTHTMVGTPAKDFIMVLAYRHKVKPAAGPPTPVPLVVS
ncbi:hypothetical protein LUZ60_006697 [Juncus effusus]|nr:hypothetical protein LUZ60_006697 [Juncus effusus]